MFEYINFERRKGEHSKDDIKLFGLSTCGFCKRAIDFLEENNIQYDLVFMDEIDLKLKIRAKKEFQIKFYESMSFPALVINEVDFQIGFIRIAWERMFSSQLISRTKKDTNSAKDIVTEVSRFVNSTAAYKKWYINPDNGFRMKLEEGLLVNYKRYGFYHCPCRDSDGEEHNRDIACPCSYAEDDIKDWEQCFCGLYVSKEFHDTRTEPGSIPERREES